jgi:hypothetical protein
MMTTRLLLDFDGVLLRNKNIDKYQHVQSALFVRRVTGLSLEKCQKFNQKYFPIYGHTVSMLNNMLGANVTIQEYDDFVFDTKKMRQLNNLVTSDTKEHMLNFDYVIKYCKDYNVPYNVFSNANVKWIDHFCHVIGSKINEEEVIWPNGDLTNLKPKEKAYDNIENKFDENRFLFVDDAHVNLDIPEKRERWIPVHFNREEDTALRVLNKLHKVVQCKRTTQT